MGETKIVLLALIAGMLESWTLMFSADQQEATQRPKEASTISDSRVLLVLEKAERADVLLPSMLQRLNIPSSAAVPKPASTNNFLILQPIIKKVMRVHIVGLGSCILWDSAGNEYKAIHAGVMGVEYLENDFRSPAWIIDGARADLVFEIPKAAKPAKLAFVYQFKEGWDGKSKDQWKQLNAQSGTVEIPIRIATDGY